MTLGSVDNERNGGIFGQNSPSAALKMRARCSTLLRFLPGIRGFCLKNRFAGSLSTDPKAA